MTKNVILYDFFKLLLDVLRCCFRYAGMFLGPLEGILSPRIHFGPIYEPIQMVSMLQCVNSMVFSSNNTIWSILIT